MFTRIGMMILLALVAGSASLGFSRNEASAADKVLTLTPTSGIVGTVVTGELFNAPPNDFITVIVKIPGDPVVATGTTDANGYLKVTFTVPYTPGGGTFPVFFTDFKCSCQIATDFTIINSRPTPIPTATPTTPPVATPTKTPPPPPTAAIATPTATPTPGVPVAGTGPGGTPGPNVGVLGLGMLAVLTVLAWFAATRRGPQTTALAYVEPDHSPYLDDYSTELDMTTLNSLRRPGSPRTTATVRPHRGGAVWAVGAGIVAAAGLFILRKK